MVVIFSHPIQLVVKLQGYLQVPVPHECRPCRDATGPMSSAMVSELAAATFGSGDFRAKDKLKTAAEPEMLGCYNVR